MNRLSEAERRRVDALVDAWHPGFLSRLERDLSAVVLGTMTPRGADLFLASRQLCDDLDATSATPQRTGLPLGFVDAERWRPSLEAAALVAPHARDHVVVLKPEAVAPFLYGRGTWAGGADRIGNAVRTGGIAVVEAPNGDVLGLARVIAASEHARPELRPVIDLGWYLREGG